MTSLHMSSYRKKIIKLPGIITFFFFSFNELQVFLREDCDSGTDRLARLMPRDAMMMRRDAE